MVPDVFPVEVLISVERRLSILWEGEKLTGRMGWALCI
jgi:hypothetical protein